MKHEWRKHERDIYLPGVQPQMLKLPPFNFFTIQGRGNPNGPQFPKVIEALYAISYTVRMSAKAGLAPDGYFDYTVYPLEGIWDLSEAGRQKDGGTLDKDDLVFELMIRQPEFVTPDFAAEMLARAQRKKPSELLDQVRFKTLTEGLCVQMLHLGSYDREPESFQLMADYCRQNQLVRKSRRHREIYLTDARKTAPGKLKTVLRIQVGD